MAIKLMQRLRASGMRCRPATGNIAGHGSRRRGRRSRPWSRRPQTSRSPTSGRDRASLRYTRPRRSPPRLAASASGMEKSLRAAAQDRPGSPASLSVVARLAIASWTRTARFVFLDETATTTAMVRRHGRSRAGARLVDAVPHGHWKTTTFIAGLRQAGIVAPLALDGLMTGIAFRAYVEQFLVPALEPGDLVVLDNLAAHKVDGVHRGVAAVGCLGPLPAALQPRFEPDRAGLRQAQGPAPQSCHPHQRRAMVDHRPPARLDAAQANAPTPSPPAAMFPPKSKVL